MNFQPSVKVWAKVTVRVRRDSRPPRGRCPGEVRVRARARARDFDYGLTGLNCSMWSYCDFLNY